MRDDDDPFSLWTLPGPKSLVHDGARLLLNSRLGKRVVRLAVSLNVTDGQPYAFAVPPRRAGPRAAANELADILAGVPPKKKKKKKGEVPAELPILTDMRALQALDADAAGASQREIAMLVLGTSLRGTAFNDSAVRAQVRYWLDHGKERRDGGYRQLLRTDPNTPTRPK